MKYIKNLSFWKIVGLASLLFLLLYFYNSYIDSVRTQEKLEFEGKIKDLNADILEKKLEIEDLKTRNLTLDYKIQERERRIEELRSRKTTFSKVRSKVELETRTDEELNNKLSEVLLKLNISPDRVRILSEDSCGK